jgi:hypothetical protein
MHRNYISIASIVLGLTLLLAFFLSGSELKFDPSKFKQVPPSATSRPDLNIIINQPKQNETISTSFNISGEARVFENTFSFREQTKLMLKVPPLQMLKILGSMVNSTFYSILVAMPLI